MQGQKGWQLQRRRREVLEALDQSVRHLLSLEEPLGSWEAHSAQAEAALVSAGGRHNACWTRPLIISRESGVMMTAVTSLLKDQGSA